MNAWTPTPAEAFPDDALTGAADDAARTEAQLWMLGRLAQMGLRIVEAIERQATQAPAPALTPDAPASDAPPPNTLFHGDLALAYARASRAVRMSIALQSRLMAERRQQATDAATAARMSAVRDRPARRARIDRIVERLVQEAHDDDEDEVERCLSEAAERLDDTDLFGDVLDRPVSETIALICRELGLEPDWPELAQQAWARQEVESGAVGAPLAGLGPQPTSRRAIPLPPSPPGLSRGPSPPPQVSGHEVAGLTASPQRAAPWPLGT